MDIKWTILTFLFLLLYDTGHTQPTSDDTVKNVGDSLFVNSNPMSMSAVETTGAVSRLSVEGFNYGNRYHPYQLAMGKLSGVAFAKPGGDPLADFDTQIRGLHSAIYEGLYFNPSRSALDDYMGLTQPLVVVDGIPGASLMTVDPQDIASIEVLRDMSSAAVYGARSANGVIRIRTREEEEGKILATYQGYLSIESPYRVPDFLDAGTFRSLPDTEDHGAATDWAEEVTRTAFSQAHNLAIGGGGGGFSHRLALNYRGAAGIARGSGFRQGNAMWRLRKSLWNEKVVLSGQLGYTHRRLDDVDVDVFRSALIYNPTAPVRASGQEEFGGFFQESRFQYHNPVALVEQQISEGTQRVLSGQLGADWTFLPGLHLEGRVAGQHTGTERGFFAGPEAYPAGYNNNGSANRYESGFDNLWTEAALRYERRWSRQQLNFSGGYQYQRFDFNEKVQSATNFGDLFDSYEDLEWGIATESGDRLYQSGRASEELAAFFARARYNFRETYFLSAHLRREGAARFGPENPWGWFGGVGAAAAVNRMLDPNSQSLWKVRLGWGVGGNLPPKDYAGHQVILPFGFMYYAGQFIEGRQFYRRPNPYVKWESRREWNLGLEAQPANGRWVAGLDWYHSRSEDLLWELPGNPDALGLSREERFENIGSISNTGIEVHLGWRAVQKENLTWQWTFNGAHNRTVLESLTPSPDLPFGTRQAGILGGPGFCCTRPQLLKEGDPIGNFYGRLYQNVDSDGQWIFEDLDHDGEPGDPEGDATTIGNAQPDFSMGFGSRLRTGRWEFDLFLRGVLGHDKLNVLDFFYGNRSQVRFYNVSEAALEGARARLEAPAVYSSYFLEDASFLRLEYLTIGYALPIGSRRLKVRLTGQNLFTMTGYSGVDPELSLTNIDSPLAPGIDGPAQPSGFRGFYFQSRGWILGVDFSL